VQPVGEFQADPQTCCQPAGNIEQTQAVHVESLGLESDKRRHGRSGNSRDIPSSEMLSARVRVVFIFPVVSSHETRKTPASTL